MSEKTSIWKEICDKCPVAWKEFVEWFGENHAARANHSERWVDTITIEDLNEFFEDKGVNTAIGIVLEGSFNALEKIRKPIDPNVMPVGKKTPKPMTTPKTPKEQMTTAQRIAKRMAALRKKQTAIRKRRGRKTKETKSPF